VRQGMLCAALFLVGIVAQTGATAQNQTVKFGGYEWRVKSGERLGPGPNAWEPANVWVDSKGWLHLKIAQKDGKWTCAEVGMTKRLGFGTYEFQIEGWVDRLDRNVVLGLFNYPTRDVGGDSTHEIDIEFARWGLENAPIGNYTVWPAKKEAKQTSETFRFTLTDALTTHRFHWKSESLLFESLRGRGEKRNDLFHRWRFEPEDFAQRISQQPMPILLNLWLFRGSAPTDGKEVEIVVRRFRFTPSAEAGK
jgi:hypothetical protein